MAAAALIPVMTAAGPDITRSARGRLAAEIALVPTAFQQPGGHPANVLWVTVSRP